MPYRPYEYVPQFRQQDDGRLREMMYLQGQNEANRLRQQGQNSALMWAGIGRAGSNMLSELAQYKREAPMRAETERKRKEADKLRGLDQLAGGAGMDETARGELYRKEGFGALGQDIIAKDTRYKADKATLDREQKMRLAEDRREVAATIARVEASPDPTTEWANVYPNLATKLPKEEAEKLPPVWDPLKAKGYRVAAETYEDITKRNAAAESAMRFDILKEATFDGRVKRAKDVVTPVLEFADTKPEWDAMIANVNTHLKQLPESERETVFARLGIDKEFSPEGYKRAVEIQRGPDKKPENMWDAGMQAFFKDKGHYPQTLAEFELAKRMTTVPNATDQVNRLREANDLRKQLGDDMKWLFTNVGTDPKDPTYRQYATQFLENYSSGLAALGMSADQMGGVGAAGAAGRGGVMSDLAIPGGAGGAAPTGTGGVVVPDGRGGFVQLPSAEAAAAFTKGVADLNAGKTPTMMQGVQGARNAAGALSGAGPMAPPPAAAAAPGAVVAPPAPAPPTPSGPAASADPDPYRRPQYGFGGMPNMSAGDMAKGLSLPSLPSPPSLPGAGQIPARPGQPRALSDAMGYTDPTSVKVTNAAPPDGMVRMMDPTGQRVGLSHPDEVEALIDAGWKPVEEPAAPPRQSAPPPRMLNEAANSIGPSPNAPPEEIIDKMSAKVHASTPMNQRLEILTAMMSAVGFDIVPVSETRTAAEQAKLYAKGRTAPGTIVTEKSGKPGDESKHQTGKAVDFAFLVDGKPSLDPNLPWHLLGLAAKKAGLEWGGDWQSLVDRPHVQMMTPAGPQEPLPAAPMPTGPTSGASGSWRMPINPGPKPGEKIPMPREMYAIPWNVLPG